MTEPHYPPCEPPKRTIAAVNAIRVPLVVKPTPTLAQIAEIRDAITTEWSARGWADYIDDAIADALNNPTEFIAEVEAFFDGLI